MGRPSIDPELMIRMLLIGYCCGIRSERRLCQEVSLNLAYRWFCRLDLTDPVPDHSTFSKNRPCRFRDSGLLRKLFEASVRRCMGEGIVGGEGFVVDASMIRAEAHRQRGVATPAELDYECPMRAVSEYLAVLDDAAFGAASEVAPKFISPVDPAARWTAAANGPACYAYCDNYPIDLKCAVIVDIEPTTAIRQAEVTAAKTMIARTAETFGVELARLAADTGYGSAEMLAWLVHEQGIEPQRNGGAICATSRCSTSQNARTAHSRATTSGSTTKATPTPARPASSFDDTVARSPCRGPGWQATTPCVTGPARPSVAPAR